MSEYQYHQIIQDEQFEQLNQNEENNENGQNNQNELEMTTSINMIKEHKQKWYEIILDIWNSIPFIRQILNFLIISLQIVSGIVTPGLITFVHLFFSIIESVSFVFFTVSVTRVISFIETVYSLILFNTKPF